MKKKISRCDESRNVNSDKSKKRRSKTVTKVDISGTNVISEDEFINSENCNKAFRKKISQLCEKLNIVVTVLQPGYFDKGVKRFGKKKDGYAVVYDYDKTVDAIAEEYMKDHPWDNGEYTFENARCDAIEWVNYNTLRSIPYMQNSGMIAPIVVYTDENGKEQIS